MKAVNIILITLCIIGSTLGEYQESFYRKLFTKLGVFPDNTSDYATSCSNINLPQYDGVTMSGYLNVGIENSSSALGFIFFGAKGLKASQLKSRTTLFWLNGGPGCSSQIGNFFEIGPFRVTNNTDGSFNLISSPNSWTNEYNIIFIDQPIGTGISYAQQTEDIPVNQAQVAQQFYNAVVELYENKNGCFKQLGINAQTPLFMYGESYAGKYIPSIAYKMFEMGNVYKLRGIGIIDGSIDLYQITESIPQFALDLGMIDSDVFKQIQFHVNRAQEFIKKGNYTEAKKQYGQVVLKSNPLKKNVYNILEDSKPDKTVIDDFFNSKQGQDLFKLKLSKEYKQCNATGVVYKALQSDFMKSDCVEKLSYLVKSGLSVNIMNGNLDLIVPYYATQKLVNKLSEFTGFSNKSIPQAIKKGEEIIGYQQRFSNLIFTVVTNAGHMIPADKPEACIYFAKQHIDSVLSQRK